MADAERSIETLIYTYAALVDEGDLEGVADLLAEATIGLEGTPAGLRGRDRILALLVGTIRIHDDGTPRTKHVTTNVRVEVDPSGDGATARSYFTVLQAAPGVALQPVVAGRYHDRFERRPRGWVFVERRFTNDLVGDVSRHLLSGPEILRGR